MINTNIKKQYQQTTGLIQGLNNNIQLLLIDVIISEKSCFRKCLVVVHKLALHGQQFYCQTGKGNSQKHVQFSQGVPVWRIYLDLSELFQSHEISYTSIILNMLQ